MLADAFECVGVRPQVRNMVVHGPREQLTHAIGGDRLASAKQDVVIRLIHDAPSGGLPGGR